MRVVLQARFWRDARARAAAAFDRWRAAARRDNEDGRAIPQATTDHWRQQRHYKAAYSPDSRDGLPGWEKCCRTGHRCWCGWRWRASLSYMQACVAGRWMARIVWALVVKFEDYRTSAAAAQADRQSRRCRSGRGQGTVWRNGRETGLGKPVCNRVAYEHAALIWT